MSSPVAADPLLTNLEYALDLGIEKTRHFLRRMGSDYRELPPAPHGDFFDPALPRQFGVLDMINWTSSFPIGQALIAYELTGDREFLAWAEGARDLYHEKVVRDPQSTTMHDLGFLYLPYSAILHRLTENEDYRTLTLLAADALTQRFVPNGGYLKAWGRMNGRHDGVPARLKNDAFYSDSQGLTIIDVPHEPVAALLGLARNRRQPLSHPRRHPGPDHASPHAPRGRQLLPHLPVR